jgi:plastocyanin
VRFTRRKVLAMGGGMAAALSLLKAPAGAAGVVEIGMEGRGDGSRVWFDPIGVLIEPGQTVRWVNRDAGNAHTTTAYHSGNFGKPRRIPAAAAAWNSDYLLPEEVFEVTLTEPGVYDYFCVPHEHAGMVGRIIVGSAQPPGWTNDAEAAEGIPEIALQGFPSIDEIMRKGTVRRV